MYYKRRTKNKHTQARVTRSLPASTATYSVVVDPVEIQAESHNPAWSDWKPVQGGWMRRRPRVPGMNGHWGKWTLNATHNQHFRFNPASNGTHIETAKEEFQFHWNDHNSASVMPQEYNAGYTSVAEWLNSHPEQYNGDQGSTIIDESDDLIVVDPDETGQPAVDIERSGMEAERDERDFEEPTATPSEFNQKHRSTTPHHKPRGQRHRASSAITPDKSALASFADSVASTSDHAVTASSSATETANTIATWIFGTIMAGVGVGTMRATQKTADASMRSAVAGESSALSSRKSAAAAEESAQTGKKSAQAAENGVTVMRKQLDLMIQDKRGPPPAGNGSSDPPADNRDSRTGSVEARDPNVEISREQPRARSVSTATPPGPGAALTSPPADAPQEGIPTGGSPEHIGAAQTPEVTQNSGTSNGRAVPIKTTPSARTSTHSSTGMTAANISRSRAPTSDPGQSSVNQSPPRQGSSIRTGAMTVPKETTQQKEECLRNITEVQDELKSRKKERESELVLDRRLRELRNRLA